MKLWQAIAVAILLVTVPVLSSCGLLGIGSSKQKEDEELRRQQIEAIQKAQEANQKAQDEFYQQLQEGLNKYSQELNEYQQQQAQQQLGASTDNHD